MRIDGSYGEGGGQVLRTSLALSSILGRPVEIYNIRARRKNPGLAAQHLTGVRALSQITGAAVEGEKIGSQVLRFQPQGLKGGNYAFDVGTAGSISLVLQALIPTLAFAQEPSELNLKGGTHVQWSPPFHYLKEVFLHLGARLGLRCSLHLDCWGFYPRGGGQVRARIEPLKALRGLELMERGRLLDIFGVSAVANLPLSIAERQRDRALKVLGQNGLDARIEAMEVKAFGQGTALFLLAEFERFRAGFSALGERGKRAERVAEEACEEFFQFMDSGACLDPHLADQIVLYLALADGDSLFTTSCITQHLLTNLWVLDQFLGLKYEVVGEEGQKGQVFIEGKGRDFSISHNSSKLGSHPCF